MSAASVPTNPVHWELHDTHPELVETLRQRLGEVMDPEIRMSVIQLGLIREVAIKEGSAHIRMLLTTPFCPYAPAMLEMTRQKAVEALNMPVEIEFGLDPWDFSMMEEPGALDWGMYA